MSSLERERRRDVKPKASRSADDLLMAYSPGVQSLAKKARRLVRKVLPGAKETVDASAPLLSYGYGAGYRGMVCTLILNKTGVKLGLVRGAELPDPTGLLEGSGRVHRYIRVEAASDLERRGVRPLLTAAREAWRKRNQA
jgi:hypothetical protein